MGLIRYEAANRIPDRSNSNQLIYVKTQMSSGGGGGGQVDEYTKLLLHMDGTNGSTSFIDSSLTPKTVTAFGNASISTAKAKFGQSGYFDGTSAYLTVPASDDWFFGTGAWTIDFWINFSSLSGDQGLFWLYQSPNFVLLRKLESGNFLQFQVRSGGFDIAAYTATTAFTSTNVFYHVEVSRANSGGIKLFIDGVDVTPASPGIAIGTSSIPNLSSSISIGSYLDISYTNGYLDEYRVSKGIQRHTTSFTPPTTPY